VTELLRGLPTLVGVAWDPSSMEELREVRELPWNSLRGRAQEWGDTRYRGDTRHRVYTWRGRG
jgi:hypothetical protein